MDAESSLRVASSKLHFTTARHTYDRLDLTSGQIRILRLHPCTGRGNGDDDDPVVCDLFTAYFNDKSVSYEALSYAWGDPQVCRIVILDSVPVLVTTNLEAALRRLRPPRGAAEPRHLWVDALCIDQLNDKEKGHQVNLMSGIFYHTSRAILWLGEYSTDAPRPVFLRPRPGQASSDDGMAQHNTCAIAQAEPTADPNAALSEAEAADAFALLRRMVAGEHHVPSERRRQGCASGPEVGAAKALERLVDVPWWHRIWTVKEAVLPSKATVLYGAQRLTLDDVFAALRQAIAHDGLGCCDNVGLFKNFYKNLSPIGVAREQRSDRVTFVWALWAFRTRAASDPRDKVFGLLGLGGDEVEAAIHADYALPVHQVYVRAIRQLIRVTASLEPLHRPVEQNRSFRLPTWAPDFAAGVDTVDLLAATLWRDRCFYYNAAAGTVAVPGPSPNEGILALEGRRVDRIAQVGDVPDRQEDAARQAIDQWHEVANEAEKKRGPGYPTGGTYQAAFWRTMTGDMVHMSTGGFRRAAPSDVVAGYQNWAMKGI